MGIILNQVPEMKF